MRMAAEQAHHLRGFLEMAIRTGEATEAQFVDGAAETDGRHDILQRPPLGDMVVHVVGRDETHAHLGCEIVEAGEAARIVTAEQHGAGEIAAVAEQAGKRPQAFTEGGLLGSARRQDDGENAVGMGREIVEGEVALALFGATVAQRQEAGEPFVGGKVGWIGEQRIAVARLKAAAHQQFDAVGILFALPTRRRKGPHDARQGVTVGDADGGVTEFDRPLHQFVRMRAAAQEAVVGRDLELGVVHGVTRRRARGCVKAARREGRSLRPAMPAGRSRRR